MQDVRNLLKIGDRKAFSAVDTGREYVPPDIHVVEDEGSNPGSRSGYTRSYSPQTYSSGESPLLYHKG